MTALPSKKVKRAECRSFDFTSAKPTTVYGLPDDVRVRIANMLSLVAREVRPCKACGRTIYMLPMTASGRLNPFTDDAVSHFSDCPNAEDFR